jgi:hypothetical protein
MEHRSWFVVSRSHCIHVAHVPVLGLDHGNQCTVSFAEREGEGSQDKVAESSAMSFPLIMNDGAHFESARASTYAYNYGFKYIIIGFVHDCNAQLRPAETCRSASPLFFASSSKGDV